MNAFAMAERAWLTPPETPSAAERLFFQLEAMQRDRKRLAAELEEADSLIEDLKCELSEWGYCV